MIPHCQAVGRRAGELCNTPLGESPYPVRLVGVVRKWQDRDKAENGRRDIRQCPRCKWFNIFRPVEASLEVDSRDGAA